MNLEAFLSPYAYSWLKVLYQVGLFTGGLLKLFCGKLACAIAHIANNPIYHAKVF